VEEKPVLNLEMEAEGDMGEVGNRADGVGDIRKGREIQSRRCFDG